MKKQEAYSLLDISEAASDTEIKKAFKTKAKYLHPDVNKEPDAQDKFKKINEAYTAIQNKDFDDNKQSPFQSYNDGFDINDFIINNFGNMNRRNIKRHNAPDINIDLTLSFKDSVLGVVKNISFNRNVACPTCQGECEAPDPSVCNICSGTGFSVKRQGYTTIQTGCSNCKGKATKKLCHSCSGKGIFNHKVSENINIPAGVNSDSKLVVRGGGNFISAVENPSNVIIKINVIPQDNLRLENNDVIYDLNISLLEALKGKIVSVPTIIGEKEIEIPSNSKNKEEVKIPNLGLNGQNFQKVVLNVSYPENINDLISHLEK